jgi:hypothetical protein
VVVRGEVEIVGGYLDRPSYWRNAKGVGISFGRLYPKAPWPPKIGITFPLTVLGDRLSAADLDALPQHLQHRRRGTGPLRPCASALRAMASNREGSSLTLNGTPSCEAAAK